MRLTLTLQFLFVSVLAFGQNAQGLRFIQNKGQWNKNIDFVARVPGGRVGVSAGGFSIHLIDMEELENRHLASHESVNESDGNPESGPLDAHYFKIHLVGSNVNAKPRVDHPLEGHYNYFLGGDQTRWASHARAFASIVYADVYPGIDLRVSSSGNNLKYDFVVKPGADPSMIKLEYDGVSNLERSGEELKIGTAVGTLTELKPFSYQLNNDQKQTVSSAYALRDNVISFALPDDYDRTRELIIDPLLIFSTYSGSTADNWGSTATPGEHGTLYSAGVTHQDLGGFFPATPGAFQTNNRGSFDMAIIKYDSIGSKFLYATLLGGVNNDSPESLVVDKASGDLIVLGISSSPDFPTHVNGFDRTFNFGTTIFNRVLDTEDQWDIVITRLSAAGDRLVGSTFFGGSGNDGLNHPKQSGGKLVVNYGDEMRGDVITDENGNVFISSVTGSNSIPIVNGFDNTFNGGVTDGLIAKFTPDLSSVIWSTYLGGSGFDAAYSIRFDNNKDLVVAGGTSSSNFPVTTGAYQTVFNGIVDGWIARISADGSAIMNSTFTGTSSFDQVYFIDLNSSGNIFCYGQTAGHMPITSGTYRNANSGQFLQKFSSDLSTLQISTVFGSGSSNGLVTPNISPTAFLVNDCNNIYMAGWGGFVNSSTSTGFWQSSTYGMPVTTDAYQKTTSGSDFYFIVLNGDATKLVYATFLGGNSSKTHVDGGTSRFDKYGIVYHAVCSGCAFGNTNNQPSSDFPTTPNAKSRVNRSLNCNNAAFKFDLSTLKAIFDTNNTALTMPGFNNVCYPDTIVFQNQSAGGKTIFWDFGDGTRITQEDVEPKNIKHQFQLSGSYRVKLKITDLSACSQTDSVTKVINYFRPNIFVGHDEVICEGSSIKLTASGGVKYRWTNHRDPTFLSTLQFPIVKPDSATAYYVTVSDANGCSRSDTLNVIIRHNVHAFFQTYDANFSKPGYNSACYPETFGFKNQSLNGEQFIWTFGDATSLSQTTSDPVQILHQFERQGPFYVKLKAINPKTCNKADSVTKPVNYFKADIKVSDDSRICEGTTLRLSATGGRDYVWTSEDRAFNSSIASPLVKPLATTRYFLTVTDANNCVKKDTVQVTVVDSVDVKWQHVLKANCFDRPWVYVENQTPPTDDVIFRFDFGDGTVSEEKAIEHQYENDGTYALKFVAQKDFCAFEQTVQIPIYKIVIPNVFTPDGTPGLNDNFVVALESDSKNPADIGFKIQLTVVDRWGKKVFESSDYKNEWKGEGLPGGVYYFQVQVGDLTTCKNWLHIVK